MIREADHAASLIMNSRDIYDTTIHNFTLACLLQLHTRLTREIEEMSRRRLSGEGNAAAPPLEEAPAAEPKKSPKQEGGKRTRRHEANGEDKLAETSSIERLIGFSSETNPDIAQP